jgi:hypothetical protein
MARKQTSNEALAVTLSAPGQLSVLNAPLNVEFRNIGAGTIRLLNEFDRVPITTFFSFDFVRPGGGPAPDDVPPITFVSFVADQVRYEQLNPGETFTITLQLNELWGNTFRPGRYRLSATYFNQYGENCYKGRVPANTIDVVIVPR